MKRKIRHASSPQLEPRGLPPLSRPSLVQQHAREETDVNRIVARYRQTGLVTHMNKAEAKFMDTTSVRSYHTALTRVRRVEAFFDQLPGSIRDKYDNDPSAFLEAWQGGDLTPGEMRKLGVAIMEEEVEAVQGEGGARSDVDQDPSVADDDSESANKEPPEKKGG